MQEVRVQEATDIAGARRAAAAQAHACNFGELAVAQASLVASELASNLLKHGDGGRLLVQADDGGIDLLALDHGVGMADIAACLEDGFSTAGTLGQGLGAVRRAACRFGVVSWPDRGTVAYARVPRDPAVQAAPADDVSIACVAVAKPGEVACGDAWSYHDSADARTVFVVDGLGHGTDAAIAADRAVRQFERSCDAAPADIVLAVHNAMRTTRGGAVAVARIEWATQMVSYAGLGNIAGAIAAEHQTKRMVSHNGTAGHNARKIQAFDYPCGSGLLVMHSDGLSASWTLDRYAGLQQAAPMLVAGVLYRDQARGRDDALVVVSQTRR